MQAELAAAAADNDRLRNEVNDQREAVSAACEEAAEARGKLFVYEQQAITQAAQTVETAGPTKAGDQSSANTTTSGKKKA